MAQYHVPDSDDLMECPYDKVHMVRAKRFQYHLMKCRDNYTGREFMTCPFNAKHEMPKPEYRHHIINCPDQAIIDPERRHQVRIDQGDDSTLKGYTDIPAHSDMEVPQTESWDDEAEGPVRVGVDPSHFSRVRFLNIGGMSSGEKRRMRQDANLPNEEKIKNMMSEMQISKQQVEGEGSLRLPKTSSYAAMANQPQIKPREQPVSAVFAYSTGRGRGMKRNTSPAPATNGAAMNGTKPNMPKQNGYVNGIQDVIQDESELIYQRNRDSSPASQPDPKPASQKPIGRGRGRGMVPGTGVGRGMGANFVAPPPGFGGLGRASAWGTVDPSFPQFVVPKAGNPMMPSSYNGYDTTSTNDAVNDPWSEN